ncbi:MAG: acyl-CoA reductase [Gemmatimonadales bacterium]
MSARAPDAPPAASSERDAGGAAATPAEIAKLAEKLRASCEHLRGRTAPDIARALGAAGARFLTPSDELRREALAGLPASSGLSDASSRALLDAMAADWTEARLLRLLAVELGEPCPLDGFVERAGRRSLAVGPSLCVQVAAGGVPGVGVTAVLRSLLVKAPTLLKAARGDALLPALFARALAEVDEALAASLAVRYWPGDSPAHADAALALADVVVAYGSDEAVEAVRARAPVTARFVAYHHRVSVGLVGRDALAPDAIDAAAADVAAAVSAYDQRGCVSPQIVYVEEGGACPPAELAARLAGAMERAEAHRPTGVLDAPSASRLQQARGTAEMIAGGGGGSLYHGGAAAWTVVWEPGDAPETPTAGRFVRVRPIADAAALTAVLRPFAAHLQTVGVAGLGRRLDDVARALGEIGVSRVAPFQAVPYPPPWWHHDGRGPLIDLVRWVDVERTADERPTPPASAAPLAR